MTTMDMEFRNFRFNGWIYVPDLNATTSTFAAEGELKIPSLEEMNGIWQRLMMGKLRQTLRAIIAKRTGGCQVYPDEHPGSYWIVPLRKEGESDDELARRAVLIDCSPASFEPNLKRRFSWQ